MTISEPVTLDQIVTLAQRLSAADQLRLIARLAPHLVAVLPEDTDIGGDPWEALLHFSDDLVQEPPPADDSAELLSSLRR
ncbi:MAG: hypothetical protein ACLFVO_05915 [Chloroflexaceae bacterium]